MSDNNATTHNAAELPENDQPAPALPEGEKVCEHCTARRAEIAKDLAELLERHNTVKPIKGFLMVYLTEDGESSGHMLNVEPSDASLLVGEVEIEMTDFKSKIAKHRSMGSGFSGSISELMASLGAVKLDPSTLRGLFGNDEDAQPTNAPKPN